MTSNGSEVILEGIYEYILRSCPSGWLFSFSIEIDIFSRIYYNKFRFM